jgi:hypothetical protein
MGHYSPLVEGLNEKGEENEVMRTWSGKKWLVIKPACRVCHFESQTPCISLHQPNHYCGGAKLTVERKRDLDTTFLIDASKKARSMRGVIVNRTAERHKRGISESSLVCFLRTKELHGGVQTISGFTLTLNHNESILREE